MTITLYLYSKTLLRDLQTLLVIFKMETSKEVEDLKSFYKPLNISTQKSTKEEIVAIQVTPTEFALIGVFNGGI